jgi:hypothetical protein
MTFIHTVWVLLLSLPSDMEERSCNTSRSGLKQILSLRTRGGDDTQTEIISDILRYDPQRAMRSVVVSTIRFKFAGDSMATWDERGLPKDLKHEGEPRTKRLPFGSSTESSNCTASPEGEVQ